MDRGPVFDAMVIGQHERLGRFARALCRNEAGADDLVQDTMLKAFASHDKFAEGTDIGAWLVTILRNTFYSNVRKAGREVEDGDGVIAGMVACPPNQLAVVEISEIAARMLDLPGEQRASLMLIALGETYEDAAASLRCEIGTVKSRVHRARLALGVVPAILSDDDGMVMVSP